MRRYRVAALVLAICATGPTFAQDSDELSQKIIDAFRGCPGKINPLAVKGGNMTAAELPGIGRPIYDLEAERIETPAGRLFQYRYRRGGADACGVAFYGAPPGGIVDGVSTLIKNAGLAEQNGPASQWMPAAQEIWFGAGRFHRAVILSREPSNNAPSFQADYSELLFF